MIDGYVSQRRDIAAARTFFTAALSTQCQWPHDGGLRRAVDKTSGTRVTNFYRNDKAYKTADRHNGGLDRDNDNIACEKR